MYPWVKRYIGIPFVSNGRTREGCDCYGLCRLVLANEFNVALPELSNDYRNALNIREIAGLFEKNMPVLLASRQDAPEEKTLAVIREQGRLCHIGIYAGDGYILHTTAETGSACQRISHPDLAGRIEGYYHVS
jgi:cell wall-associated NlpC family hydrolase